MAIQFVNNVDFNANQAQSIRIENVPTDPSTELVLGRIIFNTAADTLKQYVADAGTGSPGWVEVGSTTVKAGTGIGVTFAAGEATVRNTGLVTVLDGTFIDLTKQGGGDNTELTADLSATGVPDNTKYLRGDNTWSAISGIYAWDIAGDTGTETIINGDTVTFAGDTNITTAYDTVNNILAIDLDDSVTLAGELTVNGTGQSSFTGQVTIPTTPVNSTDAASKAYVDGLVSGGLTFKGTFRADSGLILSGSNSGSYLYNCPGGAGTRVAVAVGDYYVVATAGGQFYCSGDQLDIGDSIIAVSSAAADSSVASDWSIVQSDEGVVSLAAATANDLLGINVDQSVGNVKVGLDVDGLTEDTSPATDDTIVIYDTSASTNKKATLANIAAAIDISKGVRISLDGSLAYVTRTEAGGLTTFAIAVNNSSVLSAASALDVKAEITTAAGQTVYADITRTGTTLSVIFTGSVANATYSALLVDVG